MTQEALCPSFIGLLDLGFAGILLLVASVLGVLMGAIGILVVGTCSAVESLRYRVHIEDSR